MRTPEQGGTLRRVLAGAGAVIGGILGFNAVTGAVAASDEAAVFVDTPGHVPAEHAPRARTQAEEEAEEDRPRSYLEEGHTLKSWLLTTDHKRIAILYALSITFFFFIGGAAVSVLRLQLVTPRGDMIQAETYNKLFTIHGVVMVWFFLIPAVPAVLGNFLMPLMIGARDLAFPKLNLFSWYLFMFGGTVTLVAILTGGVATGWTFYTPLSTTYTNGNVLLAAAGVFITGFSTILTGLNFIATTHKMRAPGLTWFRLPLFVWTIYATSLIMVLATPVLALALALIFAERVFHIGIFDPALGGDPVLFQHLFWFYSHPAVYIMILPGMGIVSEIIPCFARKRLFSYQFVVLATFGIALFGFLVWGHHMFVAGMSLYGSMVFSILSFLVAIPSAIKVFTWTATLYKGSIRFDTPMLYSLGFVGLFTVGGLTGLFLASLPVDVSLHDTYFVIAHFHFIMVGGMVMAYLGGVHFWWPKITGRMYPEFWGKLAALIIFIGFNLTFLPQFLLGRLGMPRRYYSYAPEYQTLNILSTAGASILAVGYILPLGYLLVSLRLGRRAPANPWGATGLEWQTFSPPPKNNFVQTPLVTEGPYLYDPEEAEAQAETVPIMPVSETEEESEKEAEHVG